MGSGSSKRRSSTYQPPKKFKNGTIQHVKKLENYGKIREFSIQAKAKVFAQKMSNTKELYF